MGQIYSLSSSTNLVRGSFLKSKKPRFLALLCLPFILSGLDVPHQAMNQDGYDLIHPGKSPQFLESHMILELRALNPFGCYAHHKHQQSLPLYKGCFAGLAIGKIGFLWRFLCAPCTLRFLPATLHVFHDCIWAEGLDIELGPSGLRYAEYWWGHLQGKCVKKTHLSWECSQKRSISQRRFYSTLR